jgi:hypothetical protein
MNIHEFCGVLIGIIVFVLVPTAIRIHGALNRLDVVLKKLEGLAK